MKHILIVVLVHVVACAVACAANETWLVDGKSVSKIEAMYMAEKGKASSIERCSQYEWDGKKLKNIPSKNK